MGEPVVVSGSDRLVLRRATGTFWVAGRCEKCGEETASIDLDAHERECSGPAQSQRTVAPPRPAQPQPRRQVSPVDSLRPAPPGAEPDRAPVNSPRSARSDPQAGAQRKQRLSSRLIPSRPTALVSRRFPKPGRQRRSRRSALSANSRRLALIYAYAISVLVVALIIFLAIVVIIVWVDPSTAPGPP